VSATALGSVYGKITRRLVPFLMLLYMVAFLDRVNISFAALTMNRDLGIDDRLYGFAAGVFFLGYCLFEVPANIMLARIGARRWIAALLVVWGLVSVGTAFVPSRNAYVAVRFLLGMAEAGFYPGVIFYLTLWLPAVVRTRVMALFMMAIPISSFIGSPISAHILLMDSVAGLRGWQWLFILEGSPAVLLGVATWFVLVDKPESADWLTREEKAEIADDLQLHSPTHAHLARSAWRYIARDSLVYFLSSTGLYGLSFFLPKILVASGVSATATGWWAAVPYGCAAICMAMAGRMRGGTWLNAMYLVSAAGFAGAALLHSLSGALFSFVLAAVGIFVALPLFWSAATARMSARSAGAAIAIINSIGAVGAFCGPFIMGWLHDATHAYTAGLFCIAGLVAAGGIAASGKIEIGD
jgi:ACS family tartrate transporter-like MFS transporter